MINHKQICKWFKLCPLKRFFEEGKLNRKWVENYCWGDFLKCSRYQMEEKNIYHPDNMMPDGTVKSDLK